MARIYNQASSHRLGVELVEFLSGSDWTSFETAVAWVRRSGTRHLKPCLISFLQRAGIVKFVVGIDIENTSKEGLEDLLSLEAFGQCETFIYHNEYSVVFHPKIYLFSNGKNSRLIVGSNNLTEAGLFTNTECSLQIDAKSSDAVVVDVRKAIALWSDESEKLAFRLTERLLGDLLTEGYVLSEQVLRKRRKESEAKRLQSAGAKSRRKLFGSKAIAAPVPPKGGEVQDSGGKTARRAIGGGIRLGGRLRVRGYQNEFPITNVLLMRVRPARGTQVQLPIPLRECDFFSGCDSIVSGRDNGRRVISATKPERGKGSVNTYKVEMPETAGIQDPLVRLDRTDDGIVYHVYSAQSKNGVLIYDALSTGQQDLPPTTILTKLNDPEHSTWYKFI